MRTKALFAAAAILAAGLASSMAQSNVYSLNVVGYVNVVIKGSGAFNLLNNPLKNTVSNGVTNLFKTGAQDGDLIYTWDPTATDFSPVTPGYATFSGTWDSNTDLPPGRGFFYVSSPSSVDRTNTFVGEVIQGPYTNSILGFSAFNCIGSSAPTGGSFTNAIVGLTPQDGDLIYAWDAAATDFNPTTPGYATFSGTWDNPTFPIAVGEGFFYVTAPSSANTPSWVRNFTVQ